MIPYSKFPLDNWERYLYEYRGCAQSAFSFAVHTQLLPIRVLANTSASDPLVPFPSPWDSVEDADEDVDDP